MDVFIVLASITVALVSLWIARRAQIERRHSEEQSRLQSAALDAAANGIVITDQQGKILWVNAAFTVITGYSAAEVIGQTPNLLRSGVHSSEFYQKLWETILAGRVWSGETINRRKEGSLYTEEQTIAPVRDERGAVSHFIAIKQDITARKQTEQAERQQRVLAEALAETIAALNSSLNFDEVLDLILANLARVVPHDAATVALIDGQDIVHMQRVSGHINYGTTQVIPPEGIPLDEIPYWLQQAQAKLPVVSSDTYNDPGWVVRPATAWIRSYTGAPIIIKGQVIGLLNADSATPGFFTQAHAELLQTFANQAAVAIEKARLFAEMERLAITDGLTELFNRRHFMTLADNEFKRALRYGDPISAIMMDVDYFKNFNDTYGHAAGDQVLHSVAQACKQALRSIDIIGRYGGEEFVALLPHTPLEHAQAAAERLRALVEKNAVTLPDGKIVNVTASFGVAASECCQADLTKLLDLADQALYAAKRAGRNRVESYCL